MTTLPAAIVHGTVRQRHNNMAWIGGWSDMIAIHRLDDSRVVALPLPIKPPFNLSSWAWQPCCVARSGMTPAGLDRQRRGTSARSLSIKSYVPNKILLSTIVKVRQEGVTSHGL
jgi:hypothetical protein